MRRIIFAVLLGTTMLLNGQEQKPEQAKPYTTDWVSLQKHKTPKWFLDAKFGIYCHWGIYSVPAFGSECYPHDMYTSGSKENKYHLEKY